MNNIFKLPNPELWGCTVIRLAKGHSLLKMRLTYHGKEDTNVISMEFGNVDYFRDGRHGAV